MEAEEIERYLAEPGTELKNRGLNKPVRVLLQGGQQRNAVSIENALNQLFGREGRP